MPAHGSPSWSRSGTVKRLCSPGSVTVASSAQVIGVETGAPGIGRREYAEAMVRSRQFWLKSTKMRAPRSSFHHAVVTPSSRRSSSRPNPIAACRTSANSQRGSIRTKTWTPRLPEVFG